MRLLELPQSKDKHYYGNLSGSLLALQLATASQQAGGPLLVITRSTLIAEQLAEDIAFFKGNRNNIMIFPDWETLPYDRFSPHQDIISDRLSLLNKANSITHGIILANIHTLLQPLPPESYIHAHSLVLKVGEIFNTEQYRQNLEQAGYNCVSQVMSRGEFAVRGAIFDIFPMGAEAPYRIDLLDNEVDSIRIFDPDTQRSSSKVDAIHLLPAREFPLTPEAAHKFKQAWQQHFPRCEQSPILYAVTHQKSAAGIEYYLPLFFEKTSNLLDYLPKASCIVHIDNTLQEAEQMWRDIKERYEQYRHDPEMPLLAPNQLFTEPSRWFELCKDFAQVFISSEALNKTGPGRINFKSNKISEVSISAEHNKPLAKLEQFLQNTSYRSLFCADSAGRREILIEHLQRISVNPARVESWQEFLETSHNTAIIAAPLQDSFGSDELECNVITESQLFTQRVAQSRRRQNRGPEEESGIVIRDLSELNVGDPIVHIEHGIGRYQGLITLNLGDYTGEFLSLSYANEDKLYVPIGSLHLIRHYRTLENTHTPLNKLGTDKWAKSFDKAAKRIRDVAAELLEIYAKRSTQTGFACQPPDETYQSFADGFPFEETADQARAIQAVIQDMTSSKPMDRLLCGDVGFGKTEVAMRAAYLAVQNGKQVAILVPTTLLAQQHYENFSSRFANWPVKVEGLSRFRTASEQNKIVEQLKSGKVDIVIGTHRLLNPDVQFKDLGLLIIDEEHRFGVRHKERLKSLRANVDILSMTATPIPRTLNMALAEIRDLSIIATPPAKRLSVKTFVKEFSPQLIKEAILRETLRGGQVYYLHNNVETIKHTVDNLQTALPGVKITFAHGQMRERELEQIMVDFYHNRFQVLVCTTIIETGIDVPNANTIIIDRADKFGLAQLHQLRGRVGRSHHQAYAYLLAPPIKTLAKDAQKRLEAIEAIDELGAGFNLASHDLEIRGAGELLGEEQSGNIEDIGVGLYMELLDRTVKSMKSGKVTSFDEVVKNTSTEVDLRISALIPEDYVPDVHKRLTFYKQISSANDETKLQDIQVEMIDRFGLLPEPAKFLFACAEIRLAAESLGIKKIEAHALGGKLEFKELPNIDPMTIIKMVQKQPTRYQLNGPSKFIFKAECKEALARIKAVQEILQQLRA
ncbi:MAG: transcription-repair coupling factor [Gammaproteobacteria bacterium]|jgi:transcription-repair coupling factor (superfamily II helicase)|nr:transcription-repair coupling factor [Gammaproteobacteria bacterium]